jgi:hypothetical protein
MNAVHVELPEHSRPIAVAFIALGLTSAAAGLVLAPERTWPNLLLGNLYLLTMALAGAIVVCMHYLSGAGWSVVLRRVPEAMMSALPVGAVLMLTVFFGRHTLYPWANPDALTHAPLPADKALYLSTPLVFLRMSLVLALWTALVWAIRRTSLRQDEHPAPPSTPGLAQHRRLVTFSALFVVAFAITFALASVDWLMSLDPHWYSTIFAIYLFAGVLVSGLAAVTLIVLLLRALGPLEDVVGPAHLHDLGKLLFAFSTFWAYIWFSQYLLTWYTNLPEEVPHYLRRTGGGWAPLFFLNLGVNWVIPFVVLLSRAAKRSPRVLAGVCLVLLCGHWLDLYLLIMPEVLEAPAAGPLEIVMPLSYSALFFSLTFRALGRASLVPLHDPYLEASLSIGDS